MSIRNGIKLTEDPQASAKAQKPIVDGATRKSPNTSPEMFLTPTVLDGLPSASQLANTEIFGPVLSLVHANSIEEAMEFLRRSPYGNQAIALLRRVVPPRANSATKRPQEISASISRRAPMAYFPSVAGKKVSSAFFTAKDATPWNFSPSPKSLSSAGRARKTQVLIMATNSSFWTSTSKSVRADARVALLH